MHYIYYIVRDDLETYIGVSKDVKKRMRSHFQGRGSKHLKGRSFKYSIMAEGSEEDMYAKERELIAILKPTLNIAAGGCGGNTGGRKGEENHFAKITEDTVVKIRQYSYNNPKVRQTDIAEMFSVSRETISNICTGKSWQHAAGPIQNRVKAKYSEAEFLTAYRTNSSPSHLATKFNISRATVYNLIKKLITNTELEHT